MVQKLNKLCGRGNPPITRIHAADVDFVRIFRVLTDVDNLVRPALSLTIAADLHTGDATRTKNIRLNISIVRLARHLFDDPPKKAISKVGIDPLRTRLAGKWYVFDGRRN